jgi:hypothetical protein
MSDVNLMGSGQGDDRGVCRGRVVVWEGVQYRVLRRRPVDGLAMLQTSTHEVFLASLDGGTDPEWMPENEVQPAGE